MSVLDSYNSLVGRIVPVGHTSAASDDVLSTGGGASGDRQEWRRVYDVLLAWREDPERAGDDDFDAPSRAAIEAGLRAVAGWMYNSDITPPRRVGPSVDGGVAFEWDHGKVRQRVAILNAGVAEIETFSDGRLVASERGPVGW